jgi:putative endonuclease
MVLDNKKARLKLGDRGEKVAANYLIAQGYEIIAANFSNDKGYRLGEIDLVVKNKQGKIIFVEVKTRKNIKSDDNYGIFPENAITPSKIQKLEKAAAVFLKLNGLMEVAWRIDAVAVIFNYVTRKVSIKHIKYIRV